MVSSRVATALAGLVASLILSALLWRALGTVFFFLFVPFVPFLLRGRGDDSTPEPATRHCSACGFHTSDPNFEYCPRDGHRLQEP